MNKRMAGLLSILCLCSLFLAGQLIAGGTYNKRENTEHAPISIDEKSGDTNYAIEVKDGIAEAGTRRFMVQHDGTISIHDGSGNTEYARRHDRFTDHMPHLVVDLGGKSVYTVNRDNGSEFWIDDYQSTLGTRVSSGVSVLFPKITSAYDNYKVKIYKATGIADMGNTSGVTPWGTGTTPVVISTVAWVSGTTDAIWSAESATFSSGSTQESAAFVPPELKELDAAGDYLVFKAVYNSSGSTWYQIGRYIQ